VSVKSQAELNADLKSDLKGRVLAAARQLPSGVRADARSDTRALFLTAAALAVALFLACDGPSHSAGRPRWFVVMSLATWAAVAAFAARDAWRWGGSFVAESGMQLATVALGTPLLLLAASLAIARLRPDAADSAGALVGVGRLPCLALTLAAATYPFVGAMTLRRSTDPMHPIAAGAALGAASGASGGVMVTWWCPLSDVAHVLSAHVLPVAGLAIVGAIAGDRVLAMRRTSPCPSDPSLRSGVPTRPKKGSIAKRFISCDCSRSMGVGVGEADGGEHHDP
jgi:hypothetical protein